MKIPYLAIFRLELEKTVGMLGTSNLSKCNISWKKKTFLNVGPRLSCLGIALWVFYISTLKFFETKFRPKIKILKFGTNWVFWTGTSKNVEFEISILDLEFVNMLKSHPKTKNFKFRTKNTLLRYFWVAI